MMVVVERSEEQLDVVNSEINVTAHIRERARAHYTSPPVSLHLRTKHDTLFRYSVSYTQDDRALSVMSYRPQAAGS